MKYTLAMFGAYLTWSLQWDHEVKLYFTTSNPHRIFWEYVFTPTVTSVILRNIISITASNEVTNLVTNPLSNAYPQRSNEAYWMKFIHQPLTYNQNLHIVQQRNHVTW